jgi:hypothetical protein
VFKKDRGREMCLRLFCVTLLHSIYVVWLLMCGIFLVVKCFFVSLFVLRAFYDYYYCYYYLCLSVRYLVNGANFL